MGQFGAGFSSGYAGTMAQLLPIVEQGKRHREALELQKKKSDIELKYLNMKTEEFERETKRQASLLDTISRGVEQPTESAPEFSMATGQAVPPSTFREPTNQDVMGLMSPAGLEKMLLERMMRKPEAPIAAAPGTTLLDPRTRQPFYTAPERIKDPTGVMTEVLGPDGKPRKILVDNRTGQPIRDLGEAYKPERSDRPATLAERVAAARQAFAQSPTQENAAAVAQAESALKVEIEIASARSGATAQGRQDAEGGELLSPEEARSLGVPYGTRKGDRAAQGATPLTSGQQTKMDAQNSVLAMVEKMERDLKGITHPTTPGGRYTSAPGRMYDVYAQGDPKLTALNSRMNGTLSLIVRALGEVGTLSDGDIARARALQPVLAPIPDTKEVIAQKLKGLRELVQEVSARTGSNRQQAPADAPATGRPTFRYDPAAGRLIPVQP